jgi:diaminohydroxyphosphoribosylaminopyrimidine deaminase / 5-amino-6-(5-phosphoribosylamino)uracil reductase
MENYMNRAFQLAKLGMGEVAPNPMVGCVIVNELGEKTEIIGEGWHKKYGQPHAEANAINSVKNKDLLPESTLFVTLEPCSHFGKTPPCVDLILKHNIKKVVIANLDPNPLVAGKGIEKLKNAGIEVITDILADVGRELNKRFFTFMNKKRPYILLKWAETQDNFLARANYSSKWISNEFSRQYVHKWRSEEQAILVGTNTALHDNPQLNVREWAGNNPLRIVLDANLRLPKTLHLFDKQQDTICYNHILNQKEENLEFVKLNFNEDLISEILADLYNRNVQSVLVEGGKRVLEAFLQTNYWDEARVFSSKQMFGEGISSPQIESKFLVNSMEIQGDLLKIYKK